MEYILELIGLVIAIGMFSIAFITLRHKFKVAEQDAHTKQLESLKRYTEWKSNIESDLATIKKETELIHTERQKNLTELWAAIKQLDKEHENDIKVVNEHIEILIKEIRQKNDSDHQELKTLLGVIRDSVTTLTSDLKNHKETHDAVVQVTKTRKQ